LVNCPICNKPVKPGEAYCENCGAAVSQPTQPPAQPLSPASEKIKCQACGTENAPDSRFCEECGKELAAQGPTPTPAPAAPTQRGYLTFPDGSQIEITPSQRAIGRVDLAKFVKPGDELNQISRAHATLWSESTPDGQAKFFVEDGVTNVQNKASLNGTALIRSGNREEIKEKGRRELQNGDEIEIAELVKLRFSIE